MKNWLTGVNEDELANLWKNALDALIEIDNFVMEKHDTPFFPEELYESFCKAVAMLDDRDKAAFLSNGRAAGLLDVMCSSWKLENGPVRGDGILKVISWMRIYRTKETDHD